MTLPTVAFLGIGLMGKPMASRLAEAGYPLRVWNRTAAKAEALRAIGAEPHAELADAVRGADIVISILEAGPIVGDVIDAAIPAMTPGTLWVDMSSTRQDEALACAHLGQLVLERPALAREATPEVAPRTARSARHDVAPPSSA